MHWLFFDEHSPGVLDQAGFSYDSTVGFRETIGYRAGTMQVYKPLGVKNLLELPLHVMDTALFYPSYLNLGENEAREVGQEVTQRRGKDWRRVDHQLARPQHRTGEVMG